MGPLGGGRTDAMFCVQRFMHVFFHIDQSVTMLSMINAFDYEWCVVLVTVSACVEHCLNQNTVEPLYDKVGYNELMDITKHS